MRLLLYKRPIRSKLLQLILVQAAKREYAYFSGARVKMSFWVTAAMWTIQQGKNSLKRFQLILKNGDHVA